jgi:hypothetical protein
VRHSSYPGNTLHEAHTSCSGEVTVAFAEWLKFGHNLYESSQGDASQTETLGRNRKIPIISVGPEFPRPYVMAADPVITISFVIGLPSTTNTSKYTSEAFKQRTSLSCDALSFKDVAEGALPSAITDLSRFLSADMRATELDAILHASEDNKIEMTVCSFALHLIESNSELFALLWELSTKSRWLIVIAPHKKPEVCTEFSAFHANSQF